MRQLDAAHAELAESAFEHRDIAFGGMKAGDASQNTAPVSKLSDRYPLSPRERVRVRVPAASSFVDDENSGGPSPCPLPEGGGFGLCLSRKAFVLLRQRQGEDLARLADAAQGVAAERLEAGGATLGGRGECSFGASSPGSSS